MEVKFWSPTLTLEELCLEQQNVMASLVRMNGALLLELAQHRALSEEEAAVLAFANNQEKEEA